MLSSSNPIINYPGDLHCLISYFLLKLGEHGNYVWAGFGLFFVSLLIFLALVGSHLDKPVYRLRKYLHSEAFFLLTVFLAILVLRIPNLILFEQNPDESEWIAGAGTLFKDFRFWLSAEGHSSGPLNIFPLTLINVLGGSLNYATVRLFGLLFCVIPSVIFIYRAFKNFFDEKITRIIILPLVVCMSFINFWDIIAYNGEHIPMLIISIGLFLYSRTITLPDKRQLIHLFLLGFTLGCVPYAKMQAVPMALGMAIFFCIDLLWGYKHNKKKVSKTLAVFIIGGLIPSIFVFSYLLFFGIFENFWQSYILTNLVLAQRFGGVRLAWPDKILVLPVLIWTTPDTRYYFISLFICALVSGLLLLRFRSALTSIDRKLVLLSLLLALTSYYGIIQPGRFYYHYQILFIIPAMFFSGTLVGILYKRQTFDVRLRRILLIGFLLIAIILPSSYTLSKGSKGIRRAEVYRRYAKELGHETNPNIEAAKNISEYAEVNEREPASEYWNSSVAKKISEYAHPNERMAIWGWMNHYYIETGLIQGTREAHSYYQISKSKQQDYYLKRYVSDLIRNKPVVFVDAVGPNSFYFNNSAQRHENFPIVKAVIDSHYALVAEIEGVRIYVLKKPEAEEKAIEFWGN
jgi:hypothetical protein